MDWGWWVEWRHLGKITTANRCRPEEQRTHAENNRKHMKAWDTNETQRKYQN